ncbi:hypothetical protein ACQVUB_25090 [Bacillus mycoides]|uniref:hypothetical protein n=1 Tax=Bacillus mycoides TaxID=1405 RepID=UPI003D65E65D
MKMKKVAIASVAIGTMLTMAACSTSTDKDAAKKDQVTAQNEEQSKTTSADEASKTTKDTEKDTNTSSNEKTDKDAKNTKESSGTESNGKTTKEKEKETTGKTNDQTTSGKTTDQSTSGKTTDQTSSGKTTKDPKKSVAVKTNVKEVVTLIESLDKQLAANPKLETVNKLGKQINEKWDVIEKDIEASHPTEYKTIEQSLYPLIIRAEKENIDINKMKSLTTKTKKDLNQLLTKLS